MIILQRPIRLSEFEDDAGRTLSPGLPLMARIGADKDAPSLAVLDGALVCHLLSPRLVGKGSGGCRLVQALRVYHLRDTRVDREPRVLLHRYGPGELAVLSQPLRLLLQGEVRRREMDRDRECAAPSDDDRLAFPQLDVGPISPVS